MQSSCTVATEGGWPLLKLLWWWKLKLFPLKKATGEQERFREDSFDDPKGGKHLRTTEFCEFLKIKRDEGGHGGGL